MVFKKGPKTNKNWYIKNNLINFRQLVHVTLKYEYSTHKEQSKLRITQ